MYYATAVRRLILLLGRQLAAAGRLSAHEDVFFLTTGEFRRLAEEPPALDWKALVAGRRAARESYAKTTVPDFLPALESRQMRDETSDGAAGLLYGVSVSAGMAEGRVAVVRGTEDIAKVRQGDIIVTAVIDPGASALFGLAGGLIAEMGGTLSHGAIIVREYGIPAIVNVAGATRVLKDGEYVKVNATDGVVRRFPA
jgi:pyruvate,water dikinase